MASASTTIDPSRKASPKRSASSAERAACSSVSPGTVASNASVLRS